MDDRVRDILSVYLKGIAMGSADAVPGVSGGTIAFITGIYQRLISGVASLKPATFRQLVSQLWKKNFEDFRSELRRNDLIFLFVLAAGIVSALFLVLNLMHYLLSNHAVATYGFFFGLIAASALVLYEQVNLSTQRTRMAALSGFLSAFLLSGYGVATLGNSLPVLFMSGAVAVSAMIMPGISGSLILVIMGQYDFMTSALSDFTDSLLSFPSKGIEGVIDASPPVVVFASGAVIGLFSIASILQKALERYREATMAFLVSLVAGALRAPVAEVNIHLAETGITWVTVLPVFIGAAVFGGMLVGAVDYYSSSNPIS